MMELVETTKRSTVWRYVQTVHIHFTLDYVLKPAIYKALTEFTNGEVPDNWENGEGRVKL